MKHKVVVTQEHIDDGTHSCTGCPIARAIGIDRTKYDEFVAAAFITWKGKTWLMPQSAMVFIQLFDRKQYDQLKPFEFEIVEYTP